MINVFRHGACRFDVNGNIRRSKLYVPVFIGFIALALEFVAQRFALTLWPGYA